MQTMENPFFQGLNESVKNVVPLALKKWEIDQSAERWKEQMEETKRAHQVNLGTALLNSGNVEAAEPILRQALNIPDMNLANSPTNQLNVAKARQELADVENMKQLRELLSKGRDEEVMQPEGVPQVMNREYTPQEKIALASNLMPEKFLGKEIDFEKAKETLENKAKTQDVVNNLRERGQNMTFDAAIARVNAIAAKGNKPEFTKGDLLKYKADLRKGYSEDMKPLIDLNIGGIRRGSESEAADLRSKLEADLQEADDAFRGVSPLSKKDKTTNKKMVVDGGDITTGVDYVNSATSRADAVAKIKALKATGKWTDSQIRAMEPHLKFK
jgi:hypothetical protein